MTDTITSPYLLDTNAYFLFFKRTKKSSYYRLRNKLISNSTISFYISEITSMEIQSVLGKYRRGVQTQTQKCTRSIITNGDAKKCQNNWITYGRRTMKRKVYRGLQKIIKDIENYRGDIKAQVLKINHNTINISKKILYDYADTYNFGSNDAIIVASFITAVKDQGLPLTLITSDKGMKAVLSKKSLPFYDPQST